jgi:hypothetical protein
MIYFKTKKLFYGKHLYKYEINSPLAYLFYRRKNFDVLIYQVDDKLSRIETQLLEQKQNGVLTPFIKTGSYRKLDVYLEDVDQIKQIRNILVKFKNEFKTRVESHTLFIYTNNERMIDQFEQNTFVNTRASIYKPDERARDLMLEDKEVYIVNKPLSYKYRLTVAGRLKNGEEFARWLENNSDKIQASSVAIRNFKKNLCLNNIICYARDEKILTLTQLLLSDNIQKIERIVYVEEISANS